MVLAEALLAQSPPSPQPVAQPVVQPVVPTVARTFPAATLQGAT